MRDCVHLWLEPNWKYLLLRLPQLYLEPEMTFWRKKMIKIKGRLTDKWKTKTICHLSQFICMYVCISIRIFSRIIEMKGRLIDKWEGSLYAGNKSAKNHDGFLGNGGQHVIVVTFKTSKRSWATAGQNQNSIVEFSK